MNVTTNYPNVSLVTTNPATDSVVRDNAIRPVVPPVSSASSSSAEPAVAGDKEKAQPNQSIIASQNPTYEQPQNPIISEREKNEQQAGEQEKQSAEDQEEGEGKNEEGSQNNEEKNKNSNSRFNDHEQQEIDELKKRNTEVIAHEQAHASAGGQYAGSPNYSYETGPDGVQYAVSGEVSIDTAKIADDPQATIVKAQQIKRAALAPAEPSSQDRTVAAAADRLASNARQEILSQMQPDAEREKKDFRINNPIESERFNQRTELAKDDRFQKTLVNRSLHINAFYQQSSQARESSSLYQQV
jgi:hypothetical protein